MEKNILDIQKMTENTFQEIQSKYKIPEKSQKFKKSLNENQLRGFFKNVSTKKYSNCISFNFDPKDIQNMKIPEEK